MKLNEASWARIAQVIAGIALMGIGVLALSGSWGWALAASGLVLLATGMVGWCPIYATLRFGTRKSDASAPEMSETSAAA